MDSLIPDLIAVQSSERVPLARSPLALALCQIRFTSVLAISDSARVSPFQDAISDEFPVAAPANETKPQFALGPRQGEVRQQPSSVKWTFRDEADTWRVTLATDYVAVETRRYADFSEFLGKLTLVLDALCQHLSPKYVTRIGLRYLNEIRGEDLDLKHIVNDKLLGPVGEEALSGSATAMEFMNQHRFSFPEGQSILLHYGYLPNGSVIRDPLPTVDTDLPFFVLDMDLSKTFESNAYMHMDVEEIRNYIDAYHTAVYSIFRWCVSEDYIAKVKGDSSDNA